MQSKYMACFVQGAKSFFRNRTVMLGESVIIVLIALVFSRIWHFAPVEKIGFTRTELIWYICMTESIMMSIPFFHVVIEEDIRTGNIGCYLTRPLSYLHFRFLEGAGALAVRFPVLLVVGTAAARLMSGEFLLSGTPFLFFLPSALMGCLTGYLFVLLVGVLSMWIQETSTLYFLFQKLMFLLGGLLFPLSVYPAFFGKIALYSPFSGILYRPVFLLERFSPNFALETLVFQTFWIVVLWTALSTVYSRCVRAVSVNGG